MSITKEDFIFSDKFLGEGAYARVILAKHRNTGELFAVKIVNKYFVKKHKQEKSVLAERQALDLLSRNGGHPNIVRLYGTFQDHDSLYFLLELCTGGDMSSLLQDIGPLPEDLARFYTAELISALKYSHSHNIPHRDIKPENCLLTSDGHLKLVDFGTAKIFSDSSQPETHRSRDKSFVGTADYVSPEVLNNQPVGYEGDLWSLGCSIYQFLSGKPPFRAESQFLTFQRILSSVTGNSRIEFPDNFPSSAKDIVLSLLRPKPSDRVSISDLMKHNWFQEMNFNNLHKHKPPGFPPPGYTTLEIEFIDEESAPRIPRTPFTKSNESLKWSQFLLNGEDLVFSGLVIKHRGIFAKRRQLLLTSIPRLVYVDPVLMAIKGVIPWSNRLFTELINDTRFIIHTETGRDYHIRPLTCRSEAWIKAIENAKKPIYVS